CAANRARHSMVVRRAPESTRDPRFVLMGARGWADPSDAYVLGVQAPGDARLVRALHDGPPVGEKRQLVVLAVLRDPSAQHERVRAHAAVGSQASRDLVEVDVRLTLTVPKLNRVAPAQRGCAGAELPV